MSDENTFDHIQMKCTPPGPMSLRNLSKVQKLIGQTNYAGLYGITLSESGGAYVKDLDGNVYLDCLTGASANLIGYGRQEVIGAYAKAASMIQHTCLLYTPNVPIVELAQKLIDISPGDFDKRAFFGVSGSDATGGTLQVIRKYTGKFGVIHFRNAYHGSTGLSQQASGFPTLKQGIYRPNINFVAVDFPTTEEHATLVLKDVEVHLQTGLIGGLIAEAIQGDGGVLIPPGGFFSRLRSLLDRYGALLVVDEVQSGLGRTGRWWAIDHEEGVLPDMIATAKGLAGGYAPISSVIGRAEVINALEPAQELFTFGGHPPSAAAALCTIEVIENEGLIQNSADKGAKLLKGLQDIQEIFSDILVTARGRGLMIGLEVDIQNSPFRAKVFATRCAELGLYVGYFGSKNQVVRIEPPLMICDSDVDTILETVKEVALEMHEEKIPALTYENTLRYGIGL